MKQVLILLVLLICGAGSSCSKKIYPSGSTGLDAGEYDSATFSYYFTEALKQKLLGNAGDALKYLEQCIKINPGSDAAYYEVAQISVQRGDIENGKLYARKAVQIDGRNLWYLTLLGDIYYQQKNADSALIYYERAITEYPEKDGLKLTAGNIYSEKADYDKADEIYSYLEKKYGAGGNVTILLVRSLINAKRLDEAEAKLKEVLQENPENLLFNGMLAELYRSKGERDKAEKIYEKLMDLDSTNIQTIGSLADFIAEGKEYDDLFRLLNSLVINDKFSRDDMISIFSKLIENRDLVEARGDELELLIRVLEGAFENDGIIVMLRPELYQREGKLGKSAERLEEIITKYSDNYMAWERLLLIYSDLRNYDRLYVLGKECSTKFNMSYVAKVLYASAAMEKKEYSIALEELEKAKILAGNQDEMIAQVLSMEADVYYRKREFARSFETYRQILRTNPEDVMVLNNYAYFLAEQNQDLKEAERMIRIVISKEKENSTYLDTFAWVLYKRGKYKEASKVMEDIMGREKTEDSEWYEHYGYIMKALKNCNIAVDYWKRAYKLDTEKGYLNKEIENCGK